MKCDNCGQDTDALVPMLVLDGPEGDVPEDWCPPCATKAILDELPTEFEENKL